MDRITTLAVFEPGTAAAVVREEFDAGEGTGSEARGSDGDAGDDRIDEALSAAVAETDPDAGVLLALAVRGLARPGAATVLDADRTERRERAESDPRATLAVALRGALSLVGGGPDLRDGALDVGRGDGADGLVAALEEVAADPLGFERGVDRLFSLDPPGTDGDAVDRVAAAFDADSRGEALSLLLALRRAVGSEPVRTAAAETTGAEVSETALERSLAESRDELADSLDALAEDGCTECRVALGAVEGERDEPVLAQGNYEKALKAARKAQNQRIAAVCLLNLGGYALENSDLDEAQGYFSSARDDFEAVGIPRGVGDALVGMGDAAQLLRNFENALDYYERAVEAYEDADDDAGRATVEMNRGIVAHRRGDFDAARSHFETAVERFDDADDDGSAATCLANLGEVAQDQGDLDRARVYFRRGLGLFESVGDEHGAATCEHNLARIDQERGDLTSAAERFESAREAFRRLEDPYAAARATDRLGEVARERGELDRARERFQAAAESFMEMGAVRDGLPPAESLVEVCAELGDDAAAVEWCDRAIDAADEAGLDDEREQFERLRGELTG